MLQMLWNALLFRPLLNILIGLYNTIGLNNLGLAIIWLTILVRILLIPVSLKDEKRQRRTQEFEDELTGLRKSYANNPSVLREEQRKLFQQLRFRRWPKILNLTVQGLILVILYQVFVGGIRLQEIVDALYAWVAVPVSINTIFLGIDIAKSSALLSGACAIVLLIEIVLDHQKVKKTWTYRDLLYLVAFPGATFLLLWYLPAVKAMFILTTLLFSAVFDSVRSFLKSVKMQQASIAEQAQKNETDRLANIPHPKQRFQ